jgi:RNA polymerase sigma-70 factor (ECF subfamily)
MSAAVSKARQKSASRNGLGQPSSGKNPQVDDPEVGLMLRVQQDEAEAFAKLVERYWSQVFGRIYRHLGDREESEDMAQEVFLRLYRYRKSYQPRARFATWLFHITQNVIRNAVRSRRRRPFVRLEALVGPPGEEAIGEQFLTDQHEEPSRPLERAESDSVVRMAVSRLAHRQRQAVELQFQNHSYAEIADAMDMSLKAAKSLLHRARNQLRITLTPFMEEGRCLK